jgi:peptide/nickel transport system substrate-binding protein
MAHAVDNDQLIELSRLGLATPGLGLVPPLFTDYFAADVVRPMFDPAAANALLDEAGYLDTNGDGIRECKADLDCGDRPDLSFTVLFSTEIPEAPRELEQIRSWFEDIGIGLTIEPLEENVLLDRYAKYDWDMIRWHWFTVSDPGFLLEASCSCGINTGFNETGYANDRVDELYNMQVVEPDPVARADQIKEIQELMIDDVAYVSIPYYPDAISAHRTDTFTGWPDDTPIVYLNSVDSLSQLRPVNP